MWYDTFSVRLKDMETIQQMKTLDDLKEQLQEDASTWYEGLESLDDEIYGCAKIVTDSGPVYNEIDNDIARLCQIIVERVNEFALAKRME
jgi:hypothetical protein